MTESRPLDLLRQIATDSLIASPPYLSSTTIESVGIRAGELLRLLDIRNSFYAFESALHVFPAGRRQGEMDLEAWNSPNLWRFEYGDLVDGCFFFAEDVFGGQFCIKGGEIFAFNPETAERRPLATDITAWFDRVLNDYKMLTSYPFAHAWQQVHGPLPNGKRLLPKIPFVAGGEYSLANLYEGEAVQGMRFRGYLAQQIRNLPDGSKIEFKIVP